MKRILKFMKPGYRRGVKARHPPKIFYQITLTEDERSLLSDIVLLYALEDQVQGEVFDKVKALFDRIEKLKVVKTDWFLNQV